MEAQITPSLPEVEPAAVCEREAMVARVKEEVESGRYETPERLDGAVEKLMEALEEQ